MEIEVPKLYLECGRCHAPGVSITVVLTGLSSGEARTTGVAILMVEADGGMIRTGELIDLDPENPGYVTRNWHRLHSAQRKAEGLPFVGARAEAQVRDRSKKRFNVAGAWKLDNLEPKATLRAIIHEGDWEHFKRSELASEQSSFAKALQTRLQQAVTEGRLGHGVIISNIERPRPVSAQLDRDLTQAHAG